MAEEAANNVINNYKGVMLCSRPNEKKAPTTEKPFCGRVVPQESIGINPIPKDQFENQQPKQHHPTVLDKHKKWLQEFKGNVQKTKDGIEEKAKRDEEKFKRIKEQAEADRERAKKMKEQYNQTASSVMNILDDKSALPSGPTTNELTSDNLRLLDSLNQKKEAASQRGVDMKKKSKPKWAMTKEEVEEKQDEEVDELLDFFETNQVNDYSEDSEVKRLLGDLKSKIQKMKQEEDWKEKEAERIRKAKEERQAKIERGEIQEDKYSNFSAGRSEGRSVASERSQQRIEQLRNMRAQPAEWDKHTASQKSTISNIDDRIAKNLADQVLRNYPNMKGVHSNTSIRKLLEAQAAKVMSDPIVRPVITTVVKERQALNANTLPYLHRNPAI